MSRVWYRGTQLLAGLFVRLVSRVEVLGKEHIPQRGPFVLVANHQSILDPIFVQWACPRPLHTLTKSTQFSHPMMRFILKRLNALPTRRYRVDPHVVRMILRRLSEGEGVGIYPEGERSWDGELQPFRRGTVRVLLRAGVPIVPCGVAGTYDVWPRWSRKLRRARVRIRFGRPLLWRPHLRRQDREAVLPQASEALREALFQQLSSRDDLEVGRPPAAAGGGDLPEFQLPPWLKDLLAGSL